MQSWRPMFSCLVVACCACGTAYAQPQPSDRPFRGLFGARSEPANPDRDERLDLTVSAHAAYDDNVVAGTSGTIDPRFQRSGTYSALRTQVTYSKRHDAVALDVDARTGLRYFADLQQASMTDHQLSGSFALGSERTTLQAHVAASYSPHFALQFLSGVLPSEGTPTQSLPTTDFHVLARPVLRSQAGAALSRQVSRRSSLNFSYGYAETRFPAEDPRQDTGLRTQRGAVRYHHNLTRYAAVRLGYGLREFHVGEDSERLLHHDIDVGIDYTRALSLSRRTTLGFGTGSSIVHKGSSQLFRLSGSANLQHQMGRTWSAVLAYRRGVRAMEGFSELTMSDGVDGTVSGYVSRRVEISATGGYSSGQFGFSAADQGYSTAVASVTARLALSRVFSLYSEYLYYRYSFGEGVRLPSGIGRELDRRGVRAGVMASLPLF